MSPGEGALRRRRQRTLRHWRHAWRWWLRQGYNVVRPAILLAFAVGGTWFGVDQFSVGPWHHNIIVWGSALGIGVFATFGLYKEVDGRLRFRRWLAEENGDRATEDFDRIRKVVARLPPWHRAGYREKRRALKL